MVCFCYHPLNGVWSVDCIQYKSIHIVKIYTRISAFFINLDHSFIPLACAECYRFLAVLRSFFHSSLLYTLSFHPFPPTSLPYSLTSSCHLFLALPLSLVVSTFIYNTFLGILFSSILCTCPNQCILFILIVSIIVGFFKPLRKFHYRLIFSSFLFHYHILGLKFFHTLSFQKCFFCFLAVFVSIQVSVA